MNKILLLLTLVILSFNAKAQKQSFAGVTFTGESTNGGFAAGAGLTFERKLTRHSGIETGLFYRTYRQAVYVQYQNNIYPFSIAERHLSVPFLYKFYSSILNISVGPTIDFYVGWKNKTKSDVSSANSYYLDPSVFAGAMIKVSKEINLEDRFFLEPELRLNRILGTYRTYGGAGIALKYRLGGKK